MSPRSLLALATALRDEGRRLGLASQRRDRLLCARMDLSPAQWYCLDTLVQAGPLSMNDLARHRRISRSTATRLVDLLEKKNLARRRSSRSDRRRTEVQITEKGEGVLLEMEGDLRRVCREILGFLPPHERAGAVEGLEALARAAERWLDRHDETDAEGVDEVEPPL